MQERHYELSIRPVESGESTDWVPIVLAYLGHVSIASIPPNSTFAKVLACAGIFQFAGLVDQDDTHIIPTDEVTYGQIVVVQQDPHDVAFELDMIVGYGSDHDTMPPGLLRTTESWISTGLWHLDQLIKSQLLLTWSGLGFTSLTVWLPSFAVAVLDLWPCVMDEQLRAWFDPVHVSLHAFVHEKWGWSLISFVLEGPCVLVTFLEPEGHLAITSRILVQRAFSVSGRCHLVETVQKAPIEAGQCMTLLSIMRIFPRKLGITSDLIAVSVCVGADWDEECSSGLAPTAPFTVDSIETSPGPIVACIWPKHQIWPHCQISFEVCPSFARKSLTIFFSPTSYKF